MDTTLVIFRKLLCLSLLAMVCISLAYFHRASGRTIAGLCWPLHLLLPSNSEAAGRYSYSKILNVNNEFG